MLTGVYAARNIVGEKNDVWAVNTEMEYHEEAREAVPTDRLIPQRLEPVFEPAVVSDEMIDAAFAKLDPIALGASVGFVSGIGLFLASAILLIKGGEVVGPTLSLIGHYLFGFEVSWTGALIGAAEAAFGGFLLGYFTAAFRNWGMESYAYLLRRRADAENRRRLLDKV
jgi:hypothetical protein